MAVEFLLFMLLFGPGVVLYGLFLTVRQKVRLTRRKVLKGGPASVAGVVTMVVGTLLTFYLWHMIGFLPH